MILSQEPGAGGGDRQQGGEAEDHLPRADAEEGREPAGGDPQATFAATVVDEWVRCGVRHAVVCPGSRSTPMALALAREARLRVHVRLDERSACFFALGIGKATGVPAVICTTSGTAAFELHAGVAEAHHAAVPLIVVTADRPPELQEVGAPQTADQSRMFGGILRFFAEPGVAVPDGGTWWRSLAARAVIEATCNPLGPGPVHLNLAFRDPLVGEPGPLADGRPSGGAWHARPGVPCLDPGTLEHICSLLHARRTLLVAGEGSGEPASVLALAEKLHAPLIADPLSGCRVSHPNVVSAADGILRAHGTGRLAPEVILRLGRLPASKVVCDWLDAASGSPAVQIVLCGGPWSDPGHRAHLVLPGDSRWLSGALSELADRIQASPEDPDRRRWLELWMALQGVSDEVIARWCAAEEVLSEPGLARAVASSLQAGTVCYVSSSMPIRDIECYSGILAEGVRILANRGLNGIDGVLSSALGAATACGRPVVALLGDLAFLHDATALVRSIGRDGEPDPTVVVVVADNSGGGIFSFLPQGSLLEHAEFELLFGTPQLPDVVAVAAGMGVEALDLQADSTTALDPGSGPAPASGSGLAPGSGLAGRLRGEIARLSGAGGISVIRVGLPERSRNVEVHQMLNDAIATAVSEALEEADGAPLGAFPRQSPALHRES